MKKTPDGAERGAHPVPRALTTISVLLTSGTAATDVACFTRLGSLFASVMTSNLVATVQAAVPAVPLVTLAGAMIAGTRWLRPARTDGQPENCRAPVAENGPVPP